MREGRQVPARPIRLTYCGATIATEEASCCRFPEFKNGEEGQALNGFQSVAFVNRMPMIGFSEGVRYGELDGGAKAKLLVRRE